MAVDINEIYDLNLGLKYMKVLCLPGGLPLDYTIQMANSLSNFKEIKIKLIIYNTPTLDKELLENINPNVELYITDKLEWPKFNLSFFFGIHNYLALYKTILEIHGFDPDIIHMQPPWPMDFFIMPFIQKFNLVTTIHDPKPHVDEDTGILGLIYKIIKTYLQKKSKHIFVHGEKMKKSLIEEWHYPSDRISSITIGELNVQPFIKYMINNEEKINESQVLFFGRLARYKGIEYLLQAAPIILREVPNVKIIIAGRPIKNFDLNIYKSLITCQNIILYDKEISWKFGAELFSNASLVVLPYVEATQSGVISTAYGFKKPVVVTNVGAIPEIVDNNITGFIVPPRDPESLANAIIKLLKNEQLRKEMGDNAYNKLKTDMSWDSISREIIEVYFQIIRGNPCR